MRKEEIDKKWLKARIKEGLSVYRMAKLLGTSEGTVVRAIKHYGLTYEPRRNSKGLTLDWVKARLDEGLSMTEMAALAGCSVKNVKAWVDKHGLDYDYPLAIKIDRDWLEEQLAAGVPADKIATKLGYTRKVIMTKVTEYGLEYKSPYKQFSLKPKELQRLINQGKHVTEIAQETGHGVTTIYTYIRKYNLKYDHTRPRATFESADLDPDWLREKVEGGASMSSMAMELGIAPSTVKSYLAKYGIPYQPKRSGKTIDPEVVRSMLEEGVPVIQIAERCGCSRSHIYELIRKTGTPLNGSSK